MLTTDSSKEKGFAWEFMVSSINLRKCTLTVILMDIPYQEMSL